jgi:predicted Zn-dependent protease
MNRLTVLGILAGAILAACSDPAMPDRECQNCYYSFADTFPPDTFIFHWPTSRLPVRVWADPRGPMPSLVPYAIAAWEGQFLYGEFHGTVVSDSSHADVIVRWQGTVPSDTAQPDTSTSAACSGVTTNPELFSDSSVNVLHIDIDVKAGYSDAAIAACVRRLTIHEMGHALGLIRHSPYPLDIMNAVPVVSLPSDEDRRSIEVLYHTRATLIPPPRP